MKNPTYLFIVCFLIIISQGLRSPNIDGEELITIINSMLIENSLPQTKHILKCFDNQQSKNLKDIINLLTQLAANSGSNQLKNFPKYYSQSINNNFSKDTIQCVYNSRDFKLLMMSYDVDFNKMDLAFIKYAQSNYLKLHNAFRQLKTMSDESQYIIYGVKLNLIFMMIYGKRVKTDNEWEKVVSNLQKFDQSKYYGITVSNGVLGSVSSYKPLRVSKTVLGGAYDVYGRGRVSNIIQTFSSLKIGGQCGHYSLIDDFYNYQQVMNMKNAQFSGSYSTPGCSINYKYAALKNSPFTFFTQLQIVPQSSSDFTINLYHQVQDSLNDIQKRYQNLQPGFNIMHTKATSKTHKLDLVVASTIVFKDQDLKILHYDQDSNMHFIRAKISATKGRTYKIIIVSSLMSSFHHQDPVNQAIRIIQKIVLDGQQKSISLHRKRWLKLWESDIIIEGNQEDQKNVRLMLYHCYAFINDYKSYGISPMGLSGLGYNGHVFWDMDLWIYPGILGLNPNLAKTLIQYRYDRLEAAKNNAFINGYKGAMFPWESAQLGIQETPVWALTGSFEHHISGCVAFAAWNYFAVTQDVVWLKSKGYEIISSVAQFWQSRVQKSQDGFYHINNVVCADQWAENVNDNAFTNAVAKESFRIYNLASKRLGYPQNNNYKQIGDKLIILIMDNNVTRQHDQYNGQPIKQADVNLLSFPLKVITDKEQIKRDLQYYRAKVPDQGTPAMTQSIFTILYSRLLDSENAYKYFIQSHRPYFNKPFNVFSEGKGGTNPYFLTGAGGVIQSLVFGFGGYDITQNGLKKIQTAIPKQWKSITIKGFLKQI